MHAFNRRNIRPFLRRLGIAAASLRRAIGADEGNAVLEIAMATTFLIAPLMLGTTETAFLIYDSIEVTDAAHAGATYGMFSSTYAANTTGIQAAAQSDAPDFGTNLTVTPTIYYACSAALAGTQYSTVAAASAACPANASNHYLEFVQVDASTSVKAPFTFALLPKTLTLTSRSVEEVEE